MGLTVDVQPPSQETRIAILRMKAAMSHITIPADVLELIARQVTDNIRELEGALTRVAAVASLNKQPITASLAEQTLQDYFVSNIQVTPTEIISATATYFQLTFDDLVSARRSKDVALARQIAMYIARELTGLSLTSIGEIFGGRDHTTVIHAYQKISQEMAEKREVFNYVNELTSKLKQHIEQ
jgi:chromosomal replication initiator protein